MDKSPEELLCTECGLCCDGSLLADVELSGEKEAIAMEFLGLEVNHDDVPVMPLPCCALKGTRCSVYAHRPETCRTFECQLLMDVKGSRMAVDEALALIRSVRKRITDLDAACAALGVVDPTLPAKERWSEALLQTEDERSELEEAMKRIDRDLHNAFLGGDPLRETRA
jgi:Fe-S-cluster containining protein